MTEVKLPAITKATLPTLLDITAALGVSRDILASDKEIDQAWALLPSVLVKIPPALRNEAMVRMAVAISCGLFDSAINYVWNCSVMELRDKVRRFGLNVVVQITNKKGFDEKALLDLRDAELLTLCLELNLITEEGSFFLDQCRDIRNNFSAAHPVVGKLDEHEVIGFLNRCAKFALNSDHNPVGVDLSAFMQSVKAAKFTGDQKAEWVGRVQKTHAAQRQLIVGTLHGIYCDPASSEEWRLNAQSIAVELSPLLTPDSVSALINQHQDYVAKGDEPRHKASQNFFESLKLLAVLANGEQHAIISSACKRLMGVHQSFNNFHNEPPFADRLLELSTQIATPDTAKKEFVEAVTTCATGNTYGFSHAASPSYESLVKGFSPAEVEIMLNLPAASNLLSSRLKSSAQCKKRFRELVKLVDPASVPAKLAQIYAEYTK